MRRQQVRQQSLFHPEPCFTHPEPWRSNEEWRKELRCTACTQGSRKKSPEVEAKGRFGASHLAVSPNVVSGAWDLGSEKYKVLSF